MHPRHLLIAVPLLIASSTVHSAGKPCEELKGEIAAKLDAKGVKGYTLDILPADAASDLKTVGSCEGGSRKIVYSRS